MDRFAVRVAAFAVGLLLGGFSVSSWAVVTPWPSYYKGLVFKSGIPSESGTISVEAPYSSWPAEPDGAGGAKFKGGQTLKLPGAQANMNLSRLVTLSNLARGARIASGVLGPVMLVGLAYEGINWAVDHWETEESVPDASGIGIQWWGYVSGSTKYGSGATPLAACNAFVSGPGGYGPGYYCLRRAGDDKPDNLGVYCETQWCSDGSFSYHKPDGTTVGFNQVVKYMIAPCNAGATRDPATGVCMTTDVRSATDAEVETALSNALAADPNKAPAVLEKISEAVSPLNLNPEPLQVTGPASVQGPTSSSTTINTGGTTTDNRSVVYNMTYNGGTVTVTQTTSSTVTRPDNSTETTTTTTQAGDGGGSEKPPEQSDLCKDHPEISACQELGDDEPDVPELEHQERTFSMSPEMSAAGSCPAPQSLSILGSSYDLSWQPLCDLASGVRPVVLALSWLGATFFVFAVGSRST